VWLFCSGNPSLRVCEPDRVSFTVNGDSDRLSERRTLWFIGDFGLDRVRWLVGGRLIERRLIGRWLILYCD
jgi:hypothetical protein